MPMPSDLKQLLSPGGPFVLPNLLVRYAQTKRIRPITAPLMKGVKLSFTPAMKAIVRGFLAELAAPPVLVFSDWEAVEDGSRPFQVYCDTGIYGFGAMLEQEQTDGSAWPIADVTRATLDSKRHWTPLDVEQVVFFGRSNVLQATFGARASQFFGSQGSGMSAKLGATTRESRGGSSVSPRPTTHSGNERATPTR